MSGHASVVIQVRELHGDLVLHLTGSASPRFRSGKFPYVARLAELHWTSGGRSGVLEISNQGRPFLSRPGDGRPRYEWDFRTPQWCWT